MSHATVFIIMDAGRADYVRPDSMPFLAGLQKDAVRGSFESPPGFAQRTVLFSGRYPDTSGNFSQFVFDPDNSPFKWVSKLGPLRSLIQPLKVTYPTRWAVQKVTKALTGTYHTDPAWIPPRFMPFFAMCEDTKPMFDPGALGAPSIFDLCREHGLKFRYLAHPVSGNDEEVHETLVRELRSGADYDLYVAQFSVCDQKGHVHGPHSDAMQKGYLRELDEKFASIHAALSAGYDSWDLFICGDHGMGPVHQEVNVLDHLKGIDAVPAKDYVVFVNSTLAVFWYLTEKGREAVEAVLPKIPGSHVVDEEERKRRRIPLERRWGDRMLAAEPGVMYWPDYFHVKDSKILGMHGYLDKSQETYGAMVIASSRGITQPRDIGLRPLVDVFPTLCDMLGVPVPETNEGTSLLSHEVQAAGSRRRPPRPAAVARPGARRAE
ncbi:MAG TPA: alkaline phosphatase family protein [Candidatus Thermoplasmatota archaeon]|nr:alkaline phosphatase family protein [Candidatus Thermoplasmatota archaeon]